MTSIKAQMKNANMSPEERYLCSVRAKRRFRNLTKLVIQNLYWLQDTIETALTTSMHKNIAFLLNKRKTNPVGLLIVKQNLAACCGFAYFPAGRLMIRQHEPVVHAMYVILSGTVNLSVGITDPITEEKVVQNVGTLGAGYTFGEVSMLNKIPRTIFVSTKTPCEFLTVTKENFERVLLKTIKGQWDELNRQMKRFPYFTDWNDIILRECCIFSKLRTFPRNTVILGDGFGSDYYTYFILSGSCRLVENQDVIIIKTLAGHTKYMLRKPKEVKKEKQQPPKNVLSDESIIDTEEESSVYDGENQRKKRSHYRKETSTLQTNFIEICTLRPGYCFNLGESMVNRRIITHEDTECMCIPRYLLMRQNFDNRWTYQLNFIESHVPNTTELFSEYVAEMKWRNYKKSLVEAIVEKRRKVLPTSFHDVPYVCRLLGGIQY